MSDEKKAITASFGLPNGETFECACILFDGVEKNPVALQRELRGWFEVVCEGLIKRGFGWDRKTVWRSDATLPKDEA